MPGDRRADSPQGRAGPVDDAGEHHPTAHHDQCPGVHGLANARGWVPLWGLAVGTLTFGISVPVTTV